MGDGTGVGVSDEEDMLIVLSTETNWARSPAAVWESDGTAEAVDESSNEVFVGVDDGSFLMACPRDVMTSPNEDKSALSFFSGSSGEAVDCPR